MFSVKGVTLVVCKDRLFVPPVCKEEHHICHIVWQMYPKLFLCFLIDHKKYGDTVSGPYCLLLVCMFLCVPILSPFLVYQCYRVDLCLVVIYN